MLSGDQSTGAAGGTSGRPASEGCRVPHDAIRTGSTFHPFLCLFAPLFLSFLLAFVRSSSAMPSGFGWFVDRHLERDAIVHAVRGNVQNSRLEPLL